MRFRQVLFARRYRYLAVSIARLPAGGYSLYVRFGKAMS